MHLIPLICPNCSQPIPAEPQELVWQCQNCNTGLRLDEDHLTLVPQTIHFAANIPPSSTGKPFWVVTANVRIQREANAAFFDTSNSSGREFWSQPRTFYIPAYTCPLETLTETSLLLLHKPPVLRPGAPIRFDSVTLSPANLHPLVEYIILTTEANRPDKLKKLEISLTLSQPELWILFV